MKKFCALLLIFSSIFLVVCSAYINSTTYLEKYNGRYEVYLLSSSSNAKIMQVDKRSSSLFVSKRGEAVFLENSILSPNEIFDSLSAKQVFIEETEEGISYYGFSNKIKFKKMINGKVINVHVFKSERGIKIGLPIIYGSF